MGAFSGYGRVVSFFLYFSRRRRRASRRPRPPHFLYPLVSISLCFIAALFPLLPTFECPAFAADQFCRAPPSPPRFSLLLLPGPSLLLLPGPSLLHPVPRCLAVLSNPPLIFFQYSRLPHADTRPRHVCLPSPITPQLTSCSPTRAHSPSSMLLLPRAHASICLS